MNTRRFIAGLILLDLAWSLAAFIYDFPVIRTMPPWAWAFCIICPIYPLLIAGCWFQKENGKITQPFLAFASVPALGYGLLALFFYPLIMQREGFSWLTVGQMLWVEVYALQAGYLLFRFTRSLWPFATAAFFILSLFIQNATNSFGYLGLTVLSNGERRFLLWLGTFTILFLTGMVCSKKLHATEKRKEHNADKGEAEKGIFAN